MTTDDTTDQNNHRIKRMTRLLWLMAAIGCVFSLSSAVPLFAIGDASDSSSDDRSLKLVAKDAEYWNSLEEEYGTLPAWFGRDGLMRVPRAYADTRFTPASISAPGALSDLIDRYYGVVLPGMSNTQELSRSRDSYDDNGDVYSAINEFVPSFRQSAALAWNGRIDPLADVSPRSTSSACSVSTSTCRECYRGYLSPTPTNPDGSDIFRHDLFDPSLSYPPASNYSTDSLVPECSFQDDPPGYLVCSDHTLTRVPRLPREKLSIFQLNDTAVTALLSGDFEGVDVVVMNLDGNSIAAIEEGALRGISNLLKLTAENNLITTINWTVFSGLDSLVVLSLRNNLISLNGTGRDIPPHHSNDTAHLLPSLAYLNLAGNPLGELNKYIFWDLENSPIEDLNLKSCNISVIHRDAFEPLRHLIHIDLFNNPLVMHNAGQAALRFSSRLLQLGLGANRLFQTIPTRLIGNAAGNLTTLNLSGNLFFILTNNVFPTDLMPNLGTLILESCSVSFIEANAFVGMPNLSSLYLGKNQLNGIAATALPPTLTLLSVNKNPQRSNTHFSLTDENLAHLKQLLWLDMSYMDLDEMTPGVLNGLSALLVLQIRGSGLTNIPGGLFSSLRNLLVLDLGENTAVQTLPRDFSTGLVRTTMLFLDHCNLDFPANGEENITVQNDKDELESYQPFREMKELELLYLHNNVIRHFSPNLLANLTNLRVLFLRGNLLQTWKSGTTAFITSRYAAIDVSNNRLTILPNNTFEEFDHIGAIDFSDNALTCNCETYDLKRLASEESSTIVCYWDKPLAYTCTDTIKKDAPIIKQIPEMSENEFHCVIPGVVGLAIGAVVGLALLLLVAAGACYYKRVTIYRRWFVYWHGRGAIERADSKRRKMQDENGNQFEYDAFISFNEHDRPWVYTQLVPNLERNKGAPVWPDNTPSFRLCLHDRDFTAGQRITENIVDNIAKSRKVVIVLSRSYVESKWCQFELHLSQHRLLESERRDDLILVVLEDVPKQQLDVGLRYLMRTRTYLAWRSDPDGQRTFWKRLRQDLMDGYSQTLDVIRSSECTS